MLGDYQFEGPVPGGGAGGNTGAIDLVALNSARAAEEKAGHVRWLRPDYQIPRFGATWA